MKKIIIVLIIVVVATAIYLNNREEDTTSMHQDQDAMQMHSHDVAVANDKQFIEHMIPHHQEAIDTSKEVLERGGVIPEVKKLAEDIIVAQESEIADMKAWYKEWFGEDYKDIGMYEAMMRDLSVLSGEELDIIFITDMVVHHQGAIDAVHETAEYDAREEIVTLSQNILTTQQEEIELMKEILSQN